MCMLLSLGDMHFNAKTLRKALTKKTTSFSKTESHLQLFSVSFSVAVTYQNKNKFKNKFSELLIHNPTN